TSRRANRRLRECFIVRSFPKYKKTRSLLMNFRSKMEFDRRIVGALSIEEPFALCEVYEEAVLVLGDIRMFEPDEVLQFLRVRTGNPAGLVERLRIELNGRSVFMQQPVLDDLELQFADTTDDLFVAAELGEELCDAFVGKLQQAFFQLLCL